MLFLRSFASWSLFSLLAIVNAATVTYTIPSTAPTNAAKVAAAPVGVSFEFFAYPAYFTNVTATNQCLQNFQTKTGTWPPIRIGGTTQDRATYDPSTSAYVVYSVASPSDAPASLTFGPNFMKLAATYSGTVVLGLNRGHNNITNTILAAQSAKSSMQNLKAIELGNEPEYYPGVQPIASSTWTPAIDAASQNNWDIIVSKSLGATSIIQAGNSNSVPPTWGAAELISTGNSTVYATVRDYSHHNYPGGTLPTLMSHSTIYSNLAPFATDVLAATAIGKDYVLGETNSVSGGGAAAVSPTFGAGIWTLDYVLRSLTIGIKEVYFHHGTIGNCYYCWWGRYDAGAPYYGALMATEALASAGSIVEVDAGRSTYAGYGIYGSTGALSKAVLVNSDYWDGTSTRGSGVFVIAGLGAGKAVKAKRLTAASALSRVDQGQNPTFGGQIVANGTCVISGTETFETGTVATDGTTKFTIAASEALLVYF